MKPYYEEKGIVIYHGDCREILPSLPNVDLVLTDPPYGVTRNEWDDIKITVECLDHLRSLPMVFTCQNPSSAELITRYRDCFRWSDVWHKTQARGHLNAYVMPLREHEDILVFGSVSFTPQFSKKPKENIRPVSPRTKGTDNYGEHGLVSERSIPLDLSFPRSVVRVENSQEGEHPNQKPLDLFIYLTASYSNTGDMILDPFMGSGTTLRAAKDLGRKAIGIEIEERYCEIAAKRMSQEVLNFENVA